MNDSTVTCRVVTVEGAAPFFQSVIWAEIKRHFSLWPATMTFVALSCDLFSGRPTERRDATQRSLDQFRVCNSPEAHCWEGWFKTSEKLQAIWSADAAMRTGRGGELLIRHFLKAPNLKCMSSFLVNVMRLPWRPWCGLWKPECWPGTSSIHF